MHQYYAVIQALLFFKLSSSNYNFIPSLDKPRQATEPSNRTKQQSQATDPSRICQA